MFRDSAIWKVNFGIRTSRVFGMQVDAMDLIKPMVFRCIPLTKIARLFIISFFLSLSIFFGSSIFCTVLFYYTFSAHSCFPFVHLCFYVSLCVLVLALFDLLLLWSSNEVRRPYCSWFVCLCVCLCVCVSGIVSVDKFSQKWLKVSAPNFVQTFSR